MAQDIAASDIPIGTKAEVQRLRLPLNNHSSCSRPYPGNKGCRHFDYCRFAAIRDGMLAHLESKTEQDFIDGIGAGPDRIGYQKKIGSTGAFQGITQLCAEWYESGSEDRMAEAPKRGDAYGRIRYAGEELKVRVRVEIHRGGPYTTEEDDAAAKTCPDCKKGECRLTEERWQVFTVEAMPRPGVSMTQVTEGNAIEKEMHEEMQREFAARGTQSLRTEQLAREQEQLAEPPVHANKGAGLTKLKEKAAS